MPRAISVMFVLVVDQTCSTIEVEAEVTYDDGTTKVFRQPARRAVRLDLDSLYKEEANASAAE